MTWHLSDGSSIRHLMPAAFGDPANTLSTEIAKAQAQNAELQRRIEDGAKRLAALRASDENDLRSYTDTKRTLEDRYARRQDAILWHEREIPILQNNGEYYQKKIQAYIDAETILTSKIGTLKEQCSQLSERHVKVLKDIELVQQDLDARQQQATLNEASILLQQMTCAEIEERLNTMNDEFQKKFAQAEATYAEKCKRYREERMNYLKLFSQSQASVSLLTKAVATHRSFSSASSCYTSDGEG